MKKKLEQKTQCGLCGEDVTLYFTRYINEPSDLEMTFDGGGCFYKEKVCHNECVKKIME